jgi:sugar/nucleoside kinase (ribokinase family)
MYDFIAIGDTVTDAFIKLKNADIVGAPDTPDYKICLPFGDKVPYEDVFIIPGVGNAANAAVSASRLGLKTALVSNIGDDTQGKDCLGAFKKDNVGTDFVKINQGLKTNYHYVLWYGPERTILIKHEQYPYTLPEINKPKWIYFSSVNETAFPFHNVIADYLDTHSDIQLAFQPGKFEIKLGKEKLERLYKHTAIFFCNVEEAQTILDKPAGTEIKDLLLGIHLLGPQAVIITDGPKGAYGADKTGLYFTPPFNPEEPAFERTGAGDAFASATTSALALGKALPEALAWGAVNGMSVCRYVGAQQGLLSQEQIQAELSKKPDYKTQGM